MKQSAFFTSLMALGFACLLMFQNCSGPDAATSQNSNAVNTPTANGNGGGTTTPTVPEPEPDPVTVIASRNIALDNALVLGEMLTAGYAFNVGVDIAHYETDYLATTKTTYAQIIFNGTGYTFVVDSDACTGQIPITGMEATQGYAFIDGVTFDYKFAAATNQDCALPKVSLNAVDPMVKDVMMYVTNDVSCVPQNSWFLDPNNAANAANLVTDINNFYNAKIDQVCAANP